MIGGELAKKLKNFNKNTPVFLVSCAIAFLIQPIIIIADFFHHYNHKNSSNLKIIEIISFIANKQAAFTFGLFTLISVYIIIKIQIYEKNNKNKDVDI